MTPGLFSVVITVLHCLSVPSPAWSWWGQSTMVPAPGTRPWCAPLQDCCGCVLMAAVGVRLICIVREEKHEAACLTHSPALFILLKLIGLYLHNADFSAHALATQDLLLLCFCLDRGSLCNPGWLLLPEPSGC